MEIHHRKHHQGYTDKLNDALGDHEAADMPAEAIIMDLESLPEDIQGAVRNNGGGYVNHSLFWEIMSPGGGGEPGGDLGKAVSSAFGGTERSSAYPRTMWSVERIRLGFPRGESVPHAPLRCPLARA